MSPAPIAYGAAATIMGDAMAAGAHGRRACRADASGFQQSRHLGVAMPSGKGTGGRRSGNSKAKQRRVDLSKYQSDKYMPFADVSRGQAGMVFRAYKEGNLPSATDAQMNMMYGRYTRGKYDSARPSTDANGIDSASRLRTTVNAISAGDYKAADKAFADFVDSHYLRNSDSMYPDDRPKRTTERK